MSYFITKKCPFCDNVTAMEINEETMEGFKKYQNGIGYIQDIPVEDRPSYKAKSIVREFLKLGTCTKCQDLIFGKEESA